MGIMIWQLFLLFTISFAQLALSIEYTDLIDLPDGLSNQDGYTYLRHSTMMNSFGEPCPFVESCTSVTNENMLPFIKTENVGPFSVTGLTPAVDALKRAFAKVEVEDPGLYAVLGTAGMLCCRAVRGSTQYYSNHAWGSAIDITIDGELDPRFDAKAQYGLHLLYPYLHDEGFFWAAGYSPSSEDAMHFEIANEVMNEWVSSGMFGSSTGNDDTVMNDDNVNYGTCTSTSGIPGECIDTNNCDYTTESGLCPGGANIQCCHNTYGECTTENNIMGTCQTVSSCEESTTSGLCPGDSTIRCCHETPLDTCSVSDGRPGVCIAFSGCAAEYFPGFCPGSAEIQCCVAANGANVCDVDTPTWKHSPRVYKGDVGMQWNAVLDITQYNIYYTLNKDGSDLKLLTTTSKLFHIIPGSRVSKLQSGRKIYFAITALQNDCESDQLTGVFTIP